MNFVNSNENFDSASALRLQRLAHVHGVLGSTAVLIATLAWEAHHG